MDTSIIKNIKNKIIDEGPLHELVELTLEELAISQITP